MVTKAISVVAQRSFSYFMVEAFFFPHDSRHRSLENHRDSSLPTLAKLGLQTSWESWKSIGIIPNTSIHSDACFYHSSSFFLIHFVVLCLYHSEWSASYILAINYLIDTVPFQGSVTNLPVIFDSYYIHQ